MKATKILLLAAAIMLSCCKKEVVRVQNVGLDKMTLELTVPATATLTATVLPADAANRAVTWKSDKPAVATVDATGKVTAVAAGTATVTVTTDDGGKTATCTVTVTGVLTAADDAKYDIPAMTVGTPIKDIDLSGALGGGKAPFTFTAEGLPAGITISAAGVISGTPTAKATAGTATITVTDGSTPPQSVTVEIAFGGAFTYSVAVAPSELQFGPVVSGYTQPAAQTVTITNTGTGAVTLTQPTASTLYTIGALSTTELAARAKATFTIQPKTGRAVGTYNETITINGSNDTKATVSARFTVVAPTTYTIRVSPTELQFGSIVAGYTQPATAQTVTITNTGTGAVTLTQPTATNYAIGTLSTNELAAGAKATFTVQPKMGLAAGTYSEIITINGSNNAKATFVAQFAVTKPVFVAVTGISGVPVAARNMRMTTLTGTVAPAGATNKTITWSIKDDGGTGAEMVYAGQFVPLREGTVTVTATIANGLTESTPYTQDFDIVVVTPVIAITKQPADITVKAGEITAAHKLTAKAKLINDYWGEGETLYYTWFDEDNITSSGMQGKEFAIPTDLAPGTYTYYCNVFVPAHSSINPKNSDVATVTVTE